MQQTKILIYFQTQNTQQMHSDIYLNVFTHKIYAQYTGITYPVTG